MPKLWGEKLDGPALITEMEKQKSLHKFKHQMDLPHQWNGAS